MSDSWAKQTWSHEYYHFCLPGAHAFYSASIALYLFMVTSPPPLLNQVIWMGLFPCNSAPEEAQDSSVGSKRVYPLATKDRMLNTKHSKTNSIP